MTLKFLKTYIHTRARPKTQYPYPIQYPIPNPLPCPQADLISEILCFLLRGTYVLCIAWLDQLNLANSFLYSDVEIERARTETGMWRLKPFGSRYSRIEIESMNECMNEWMVRNRMNTYSRSLGISFINASHSTPTLHYFWMKTKDKIYVASCCIMRRCTRCLLQERYYVLWCNYYYCNLYCKLFLCMNWAALLPFLQSLHPYFSLKWDSWTDDFYELWRYELCYDLCYDMTMPLNFNIYGEAHLHISHVVICDSFFPID